MTVAGVRASTRVLPLPRDQVPGLEVPGVGEQAVIRLVPNALILRSVPLSLGTNVALGELLLPRGAAPGALGAGQVHHACTPPFFPKLPPVSLLFPLDPVMGLVRVLPLPRPHAVLPVAPLPEHLASLGAGVGRVAGLPVARQGVRGDGDRLQVQLRHVCFNVQSEGRSAARLNTTPLQQ